MSKRVGGAIQAALEKAGHEVCLIDPGTLDLPILQTPLHFYPGKNWPDAGILQPILTSDPPCLSIHAIVTILDRFGSFWNTLLVYDFNVDVLWESNTTYCRVSFPPSPDPSQAPENLKELNEKIKEQDAFVVCTAEYNRCIPPALTNFFDHFPTATFAYRVSWKQRGKRYSLFG